MWSTGAGGVAAVARQARRAHRDYEARLLTDAVVTAIAVQEPVIDELLAGLALVMRHRAAFGLWQWASSALMTMPEREVFDAAALARRMIESGETELSEDEDSAGSCSRPGRRPCSKMTDLIDTLPEGLQAYAGELRGRDGQRGEVRTGRHRAGDQVAWNGQGDVGLAGQHDNRGTRGGHSGRGAAVAGPLGPSQLPAPGYSCP